MEQIHYTGEYHGDLYTDNIIINRHGPGFDLKVIDFYHRSASKRENIQYDIMSMIRVLYDLIGGAKHFLNQPDNTKKFPGTIRLREHIKLMHWD